MKFICNPPKAYKTNLKIEIGSEKSKGKGPNEFVGERKTVLFSFPERINVSSKKRIIARMQNIHEINESNTNFIFFFDIYLYSAKKMIYLTYE